MVRPLETQERLSSQEYVNRVRQTEQGHGANARDFSYEVREVTDEERHRRHSSSGFGEDTYEPAADDDTAQPPTDQPEPRAPRAEDGDGNLDITV